MSGFEGDFPAAGDDRLRWRLAAGTKKPGAEAPGRNQR